jgi:hypothetical protein
LNDLKEFVESEKKSVYLKHELVTVCLLREEINNIFHVERDNNKLFAKRDLNMGTQISSRDPSYFINILRL